MAWAPISTSSSALRHVMSIRSRRRKSRRPADPASVAILSDRQRQRRPEFSGWPSGHLSSCNRIGSCLVAGAGRCARCRTGSKGETTSPSERRRSHNLGAVALKNCSSHRSNRGLQLL
jgi:hypothetical protein